MTSSLSLHFCTSFPLYPHPPTLSCIGTKRTVSQQHSVSGHGFCKHPDVPSQQSHQEVIVNIFSKKNFFFFLQICRQGLRGCDSPGCFSQCSHYISEVSPQPPGMTHVRCAGYLDNISQLPTHLLSFVCGDTVRSLYSYLTSEVWELSECPTSLPLHTYPFLCFL